MTPHLDAAGLPVGRPVPDWQPPPVLEAVELTGRHVSLRPLRPADDAPGLYDALGGTDIPAALFTYLGVDPPGSLAETAGVLDAALSMPDSAAFALVVAGQVVGMASYLRITPAHGCVEIGNILYSPVLQRTTAATEAMHLLAEHAFASGYRRYEWKCDALNAPSRAAALRLGFAFEGVFRDAMVYKGRNRDTAWYSITAPEWPAIRDAQRRWLDTAQDGSPTTSLSALTADLRDATAG